MIDIRLKHVFFISLFTLLFFTLTYFNYLFIFDQNRDHYYFTSVFAQLCVRPLFSALPSSQQQLVFEPLPPNYRKVILATNIAETSLTVSGVRYVVDSGVVKAKSQLGGGLAALRTVAVSKAQAEQRRGRAGREVEFLSFFFFTQFFSFLFFSLFVFISLVTLVVAVIFIFCSCFSFIKKRKILLFGEKQFLQKMCNE